MLTFAVIIVDWWSSASEKAHGQTNNGLYLGVYIGIGIIGAGFLLIELWLVSLLGVLVRPRYNSCRLLFVTIISKTAKHLHEDLLKAAMRSVATERF